MVKPVEKMGGSPQAFVDSVEELLLSLDDDEEDEPWLLPQFIPPAIHSHQKSIGIIAVRSGVISLEQFFDASPTLCSNGNANFWVASQISFTMSSSA